MEFNEIWSGIGGALVGAFIGAAVTLYRDSWLQKRAARHLAVRVVTTLDPFVSQCCDVVLDNGEEDREGVRSTEVETPTIELPQDVDWKSIKPELMHRILSMPNELDAARQYINFVASMISDPPDYAEVFAARKIKYGGLGLTALELADGIRKAHRIPERVQEDWSPSAILEEAVTKGEEEKRRLDF